MGGPERVPLSEVNDLNAKRGVDAERFIERGPRAVAQLNRDLVLWEHASGAVGFPLEEGDGENPSSAEPAHADDPAVVESGRFRGVFPKGTFVEHVVDLGSNNRVKCIIAGYSVTTVSWAISE